MARVTGPLMSIDASGSLASSIVFSKWRGRNYVRRHAVPSNPRTAAQLCARAIMGFLASAWKTISDGNQATWEDGAKSTAISPFNEYARINARNWRDMMAPAQQTPITRDGAVATVSSVVCTVSGRQVSVAVTVNTISEQWALAITRSLVSEENETIAQTVGIVPLVATTVYFVDGPLAPGTYYYNAIPFNGVGKLGVCGTEHSAEVV